MIVSGIDPGGPFYSHREVHYQAERVIGRFAREFQEKFKATQTASFKETQSTGEKILHLAASKRLETASATKPRKIWQKKCDLPGQKCRVFTYKDVRYEDNPEPWRLFLEITHDGQVILSALNRERYWLKYNKPVTPHVVFEPTLHEGQAVLHEVLKFSTSRWRGGGSPKFDKW